MANKIILTRGHARSACSCPLVTFVNVSNNESEVIAVGGSK